MSLVDSETGEIVVASSAEIVFMDEGKARDITKAIQLAAERVWSLLLEAYERGAWRALGYSSWEAYVGTEFDMSRRHAYRLLDQGRVIREIESVTHGSHRITEREARDVKPRLKEVASNIKDRIAEEAVAEAPERVEQIVREVVAEERQKAQRGEEDAAAIRDLNETAQTAGMDTDPETIRQRGEFSRLCRDLSKLPPPEDFLAVHRPHLTERYFLQAERAYAWLDEFLLQGKDSR